MAKARMKQTIFNSKPPAVTAWIFLGNRSAIRLKLVSMRFRILCWMYSTNGAKGRLEFFFLKGFISIEAASLSRSS